MPQGGYHHHHQTSITDPFIRPSVHPAPPRLFSASSTSTILPPPQPPYMYPSPSRLLNAYPSSQYYNINNPQPPINDYFVGHVLSGYTTTTAPPEMTNNYTCIGAPVTMEHGGFGHGRGGGHGRDHTMTSSPSVQDNGGNDKEEEFGGMMNMNLNHVNPGRSYGGGASGTVTHQRFDSSAMINRYQDYGL